MTHAFEDLFVTSAPTVPRDVAVAFLGSLKLAASDATASPGPVAAESGPMDTLAPAGAVPADLAGASPEELSLYMAELISHEFKMHQWYTYYAEMIRGTDRAGLAELFEELAPQELEDGKYFARRLSVLGPGTVIPVTPNPEPLQDPMQIAARMLQEEQRAVMLLTNFHALCGDNPMRFQVEQMLADEQVHADRLQQFMVAAKAATPKKSKEAKLAAAMQAVRQQSLPDSEQAAVQQLAVEELQAQNAQLIAERAALNDRLQGVSQMAQQHMQAAQDAAMMQQRLGDESAAAQEQAMLAQEQAQGAMQEAADNAQAAAMEADAKMRLGIRIQQMRQRLSELVAEDPVVEEGADLPAIPTSTQQAGMMGPGRQDPAAAAAGDPAAQNPAAAEAGAASAPPAETTAEPQAASAKPKAKDGKVEVKVGGVDNAAVHHFTKGAGVLNRVVNRLQGAGQQLEAKAKDRAVQRGKEVVREIADAPEMKQRLERVARDAGHHAMDQAAKHPAIAEAKGELKRKAHQLAGVTAGSAAVSAGTSIYQGNKTRKAIKEHRHG